MINSVYLSSEARGQMAYDGHHNALGNICSALIVRIDGFLGTGIRDVTDTSFWPKKDKKLETDEATNIRLDPIYQKTCEIFNAYSPGLNPEKRFVVRRRYETSGGRSDPEWLFHFEDYDSVYVKFYRRKTEYLFSIHTGGRSHPCIIGPGKQVYQLLTKSELKPEIISEQLQTGALHAIKILSVAYGMCKCRGYIMDEVLIYSAPAQICIMKFSGMAAYIQIAVNLNTKDQTISLLAYSKKRWSYQEWPKPDKDFRLDISNLTEFVNYVKAH